MFKILLLLVLFFNLYANNYKIFKKNNLFGYKKDNKVIINPIFNEARMFDGNYAIVKFKDLYGVIDKRGNWIIKPENSEINFIDKSIIVVSRKYIKKKYLYSLKTTKILDENISEITMIKPKSKIIFYLKNDTLNSLYYAKDIICNIYNKCRQHLKFINKHDIKYSCLDNSEEGIIDLYHCNKKILKKNISLKIIDKKQYKNKLYIAYTKPDFSKCIIKEGNETIYANNKCNIHFDSLYPLAYINFGNNIEIFNLKQRKVIFKNIENIGGSNTTRSLNNGTFAIENKHFKYGIIDINGSILQKFIYNNLYAISNFYIGYIKEKKSSKSEKECIISSEGKLLSCVDNIFSFTKNIIKYKLNNKIGLMDYLGNILIYGYNDILIDKNIYIVKNQLNKWGVVDKNKKIIINFKYDYLGYFNNDIAVFKKANFMGYVTKSGKEIFKIKTNYLSDYSNNMTVSVNNKLCKLSHQGDKFNVICE